MAKARSPRRSLPSRCDGSGWPARAGHPDGVAAGAFALAEVELLAALWVARDGRRRHAAKGPHVRGHLATLARAHLRGSRHLCAVDSFLDDLDQSCVVGGPGQPSAQQARPPAAIAARAVAERAVTLIQFFAALQIGATGRQFGFLLGLASPNRETEKKEREQPHIKGYRPEPREKLKQYVECPPLLIVIGNWM